MITIHSYILGICVPFHVNELTFGGECNPLPYENQICYDSEVVKEKIKHEVSINSSHDLEVTVQTVHFNFRLLEFTNNRR